MRVFISIVSHGHGELITRLGCIKELSSQYEVMVKNNKKDPVLTSYLSSQNIPYIDSDYGLGFGENNNFIFNVFKEKSQIASDDIFIVLNPDVSVDIETIKNLTEEMHLNNVSLATINLFKDKEYKIYDNSIRHFPVFFDFFSSFLGIGNKTIIDKETKKTNTYVDWGAGSFLAFKAHHFNALNGFDPKYFMYCEDIDICFRSKIIGSSLMFYPQFKAVHIGMHKNRRIFTKHFFWHLKSSLRYLSKYYSKNN